MNKSFLHVGFILIFTLIILPVEGQNLRKIVLDQASQIALPAIFVAGVARI